MGGGLRPKNYVWKGVDIGRPGGEPLSHQGSRLRGETW